MPLLEAYNLFRRKGKPALCCAVRQDRPVPTFVQSEAWEEAWEYAGTVSASDSTPAGFKAKAAREATAVSGYYLFYALNG
ncbi:hypothetical protein [Methylobacterium nodulans]|uniref:Uncharacterized protein n=1 Tax=Methylobacterium nodulans (strain LMG 21967 / CNCM I-2342 / ORS 2060) TaxID=460265 RepID=B8IWT3_METNO|nr:hypothetical protein [Methylobacterium nodulans]ACL62974.1 conserved hypothetical protein [Methylobacterium nodulans ORS 2060]